MNEELMTLYILRELRATRKALEALVKMEAERVAHEQDNTRLLAAGCRLLTRTPHQAAEQSQSGGVAARRPPSPPYTNPVREPSAK